MATTAFATSDHSKSFFPKSGLSHDGWSTEDEATATCFCGTVQLSFPTHGEGFYGAFACNCYDCHKITASMFASNFTVDDAHLHYIRGKENLTTFSESHTTVSGKKMTNYFCSTCGTLMNRVGEAYPGLNFLRIGTVDDFSLMETKLKPSVEHFTKDRVSWVHGVDGATKWESFNKNVLSKNVL